MAFLQLTACGSFSHEACHLLIPFRPDCAQCLTGQQPTSSPGSQLPWPGKAGLWDLVAGSSAASLFPRWCLQAVPFLFLFFFFLLSAATRLSSCSLSLHTPQVAAQQGPETLRVVFWGAPCCVSVRKQIKIMSGSYMCFWHGGEEIYLLILQGK